MSESRLSVIAISALIAGFVTLLFGTIMRDYVLAAGAGVLGGAMFAALTFFAANDAGAKSNRPKKGE